MAATACAPICGDGLIVGGEQCDDGGVVDGDGCTADCHLELCGDGVVNNAGSEQCDDGNLSELDGCTTSCVIGVVCDSTAFPGGDAFAVRALDGHCYVAFDDELTSFGDAAASCGGLGGHLVTITDAEEDDVVRTVQNPAQSPWIGAVDDANDTDTVFDWVTGEAWSYTHFAPGQPDDDAGIGGLGECLHILNAAGEWNDTNCDLVGFVVGRICELEPGP